MSTNVISDIWAWNFGMKMQYMMLDFELINSKMKIVSPVKSIGQMKFSLPLWLASSASDTLVITATIPFMITHYERAKTVL